MPSSNVPEDRVPISFLSALLYWLKLGFISFGGPAGQISLMHQELVEKRRWISDNRFLHALNYTMVLPGPEAQQLATYLGWLMHGVWGGVLAGILFILPSFFILVGLSWGYLAYGHVDWVEGLFYGIKPAVTAIVVFAAYRIALRVLHHGVLIALSVASFLAMAVLNLPFPYVIVSAAVIGWLGSYALPEVFRSSPAENGKAHSKHLPALIDDDTVVPHTAFRWSLVFWVLMVCSGLWAGMMALLIQNDGWHGTLAQMGWFFTKAAWVTFGGAYAVLPYVYQGGVEHFGWLTAPQMIDGLALGETTPGPLIMVVTFIGFVGGWTKTILGPDALFFGGMLAASIVTFFTFLPSFLLILLGGPLVEATRGNFKWTAPLTGITAAVVGVILNLAVFFGYHVFWPQGMSGAFDWIALFLCLAAMWMLFKWQQGFMTVIAVCGFVGVVVSLL